MTVLVCGGAGYIGSHTALELMKQGIDVVIADNLVTGYAAAVPKGATLVVGDLRDKSYTNSLFERYRFDGVIDFAAFSLVGESVANPLKYFENNIASVINLLEAMKTNNVKNIVFSSTAAVYGEPKTVPIEETSPTVPESPYGESKLAVEKLLKWSELAYGIRYVALRYFNVAGADESGKMGEAHNPETHLIPLTLFAAMGKTPSIKLFGNNYPTPDGTCIRDYIHVTDLAYAHILALQNLINGGASSIYNLGNGKGFSNLEIIETARRVTGVDIPVELCPPRAGDPSVLVASSEKIQRELGYAPKHSDLENIIKTAWQWHKTHPNGYNQ